MAHSARRFLSVVLMAGLLGMAPPAVRPEPAGCGPQGADATSSAHGIVAKIRRAEGATVRDVTERFPVTVQSPVLAARGVYLLLPTDPAVATDVRRTAKLATQIGRFAAVEYAEPNYATDLADQRHHSGADEAPSDAGTDAVSWLDQPLAHSMQLNAVHRSATGAGMVVAVLDTGIDSDHPALGNRLVAGYDYVADDPDPAEERMTHDCNGNSVVDEAYGHGTFVAGTVRLVAPDARILPMRVLESDGTGNAFAVAEAITDAVAAGAKVINLGLGTSARHESRLVSDVLARARRLGVVTVAAAGNSASDTPQHPAKDKHVVGVTSVNAAMDDLSEFAAWGEWVDLAAPADHVVGPVPGGGFATWSGTSVAAPQISGQLALIGSRAGDLSADKLVEAVVKSARTIGTKNKKIKYGAIDIAESLRGLGPG